MVDYGFRGPSALPRNGSIRVANRGTALHFAQAFPLRPGVSDKRIGGALRDGDDKAIGRLVAGAPVTVQDLISPGSTNDNRVQVQAPRSLRLRLLLRRAQQARDVPGLQGPVGPSARARGAGSAERAPRGRPRRGGSLRGDGHRLRRARPRPGRRAGLAHGGGAHPRLRQRRGGRAHARDGRAAPLEPLARRALAQGRDLGQRPARARAAPGLRRRRAAGARRAGRARPATRASARASTTASSSPRRRTRRCRRSSARWPQRAARAARRARTPSSCSTTRRASARRSARRPRRSRAPRARSPTSASTRRPPTSSTT